jgi:predicted outer membrane lipoprotein
MVKLGHQPRHHAAVFGKLLFCAFHLLHALWLRHALQIHQELLVTGLLWPLPAVHDISQVNTANQQDMKVSIQVQGFKSAQHVAHSVTMMVMMLLDGWYLCPNPIVTC